MGFPLAHYYQHLPHIAIAFAHLLTLGVIPLAEILQWSNYLLISIFPVSVYWSLRRFGFDRIISARVLWFHPSPQLTVSMGSTFGVTFSPDGDFMHSFGRWCFCPRP